MDTTAGAGSDGNGVLEPGETVAVQPTWLNSNAKGLSPTGKATAFTGPGGSVYSLADDTASYGTIRANSPGGCTDDCYSMLVSSQKARPAAHWDATFTETLSSTVPDQSVWGDLGAHLDPSFYFDTSVAQPETAPDSANVWTLHIGDSFTDVLRSHPRYPSIETLLHHGLATGCTPVQFCPGLGVSRGQLAKAIARGMVGGDVNVPASGSVNGSAYDCVDGGASLFDDVAPTDDLCRHAHYLAVQQVALACSPTSFCPSAIVSRGEMARAVAETIVGPSGNIPACSPADPKTPFGDVSVPDCMFIQFLWANGIASGCSPTAFCPAAELTRGDMAEALVNAFHLQLYGPGSPPAPPPDEAPTALSLRSGRFRVAVDWRSTVSGESGSGNPVPVTSDTGAFWFFDPSNLEVMVKVLDGTPINGSFWVFSGGLSNVAYTVTVTDSQTGAVRKYDNAEGHLMSFADGSAFPGSAGAPLEIDPTVKAAGAVEQQGSCNAGPSVLCLLGGRFRAEVAWDRPGSASSAGQAVPLTSKAGSFWFLQPSNLELMVKVLDGTPVNGHFWVFAGSLSNLHYTITVTDTQTGAVRTYTNPEGRTDSVADIKAF